VNNNNFNRATKLKKDSSISINPCNLLINYLDSGKNYEFGGTSLQNNPITNPVNSYNFENIRSTKANSYAMNAANAMNAINSVNLRDVASVRNGKR